MAIIYCDGGYDNLRKRNGRYAVVTDKIIIIEKIDVKTSNEAEYFGIVKALKLAVPGDIIYSDSELAVNQLAGEWNVKAQNLRPLWLKARALINKKRITIKWISRKYNEAGKLLEQNDILKLNTEKKCDDCTEVPHE